MNDDKKERRSTKEDRSMEEEDQDKEKEDNRDARSMIRSDSVRLKL